MGNKTSEPCIKHHQAPPVVFMQPKCQHFVNKSCVRNDNYTEIHSLPQWAPVGINLFLTNASESKPTFITQTTSPTTTTCPTQPHVMTMRSLQFAFHASQRAHQSRAIARATNCSFANRLPVSSIQLVYALPAVCVSVCVALSVHGRTLSPHPPAPLAPSSTPSGQSAPMV